MTKKLCFFFMFVLFTKLAFSKPTNGQAVCGLKQCYVHSAKRWI